MKNFKTLLFVSAYSFALQAAAGSRDELLQFTSVHKAPAKSQAQKQDSVNPLGASSAAATATSSVSTSTSGKEALTAVNQQPAQGSPLTFTGPADKSTAADISGNNNSAADNPITQNVNSNVGQVKFNPQENFYHSDNREINKKSADSGKTQPTLDKSGTEVLRDYDYSPSSAHDTLSVQPKTVNSGTAALSTPENNRYIRQLIAEALNYSPEIKGKQADNLAAGFDIAQVKGQRWPQVSVSGQSPMASIGSGNHKTNYSSDATAAVTVTTNLYDFGQTSAKIKAAENTEKSTKYALQVTNNQIAGQLLQLLIQLSQYQEELGAARQFSARMAKLTNMIYEIVQSDRGRGSDLVQARARKVEADTNVINIEKQLEDTQIALTRLIGHRIKLPINLKFDSVNLSIDNMDELLKDHPKLKLDEENYQASIHRAGAERSSMYPRLNWVISKSTVKDYDGREDAWQTGLNLQWDVFNGGSTRAGENAALARANSSKMTLNTDRLEIENQLRNFAHQHDSGLERAAEYARLSSENNQVRDMFYQQWYYLGKRPLLDVLTAESSYFNNQISEIQTRYGAYVAGANLLTQAAHVLSWADVNNIQ